MTTLEEASSQDECMDDTQNEMMMTALSTGRNRNFSVARGRVHRGYSLISPHPPPTSATATTTMSSSSLIEQQHRRDNRRAVVHGANSLLSSSPVSAENQCSSVEQSTSSSFPTRNTPLSTTSISTSRSLSSPSLLISSSFTSPSTTTTTSTFVINNTNTINTTTSSTSTFSNNNSNSSNCNNSSKKKKSIMSSKKSSSRHSIDTNDDDSHHSPLPTSSSSSSAAVYSYCSSHSNTPLISYVNNPKIHIKNTIVKNSPPSSHRAITDGCLCKINYSIQYVANNNNNNTTNHHHSNNNNNNNKRNSMKSSNATQSSTNNNNNNNSNSSSSSVATLIEQADNVNFVFGSGELSSLIEDCVHLMNGPGEMSLFICEVIDYFEPWEMDYCHRHLEPLKELLTRNSNHNNHNSHHHHGSSSSSRNSSDGSGSGSPRVHQATTTTTTTNTRFHFEIVIDLKSVVSEEEQWWSFMNHGRAMHESDRMLEGVIQQKQKEAKALVMEQRYALAARQLERVFDLLESFCEATEHKYLRKKKSKMDQLAVSLLFDLANTYHMDQRVQLAIDTAGLILGMDPLNVEALVLRAHFYQTRNDLKCAMEGYIRAVDMSADEKVRNMIQNNIQTITECLGKYQVEIIGTKSEGDTTFYHIHLVNQLAGVDFKFYSRYRTMKKLYDMLAKKVPKLGQVISFPQGSWFFSNSASVINDRKEKLNQFLKYLLSSQIASQHEEARQFFIQT